MPISAGNLVIIVMLIALNVMLGVVVMLRDPRSLLNRTFLVMTIGITMWAVSSFISDATTNLVVSRYASFIAFGSSFFGFCATYIFSEVFRSGELKKRHYIFMVVGVALSLLFATPLVYYLDTIDTYHNGVLYLPYIICSLIVLFLIARNFLYVMHKGTLAQKNQARLIVIGFIGMSVFALLTNAIIPAIVDVTWVTKLGPAFTTIFIGSVAYSIIRHRLFDLRPFIARSVAYFFSVGVLITVFVIAAVISLRTFLGSEIKLSEAIFFAVLSVFLAIVFQPTKRFFDRISNSIFYRDSYDSQEVINAINSKLVSTLDLVTLLSITSGLIEKELKLSFCNFYLDPGASIEFHTAGSNTKIFAKDSWAKFETYFSSQERKIVAVNDGDLPESVKRLLLDLRVDVAVKMTSTGQEVGILLVGERKSGNSFTRQDIQLLEIIADEVAIAAQNSLRFEEIAQFNVTLQKKVDDATSKLQRSNEKLQALDEAKDEFISMASHQLRTPLTSVKGYISMMLEGDTGPLNDRQHLFLDQAFISSQRMVYLIADLLNVSRLKTGKFIIEAKPTYLPDVVESEISQLYETAKSRELELVFKKPPKFPLMNIDETKVRQVIMNFADNAIYYTPKGGRIVISLKETAQSVELTVKDDGIGVPKAEQHHLFTKFYRAGNAKQARPDGTGLGLFMAKKVIAAQGGAILFSTAEGKGSTFGFSLPREKLEVKQ